MNVNSIFDAEAFTENLVNTMKKKGINQSDLAKKTGTFPGVISDYCRGKKLPSLWMFVLICKMLDASPNEMLKKE